MELIIWHCSAEAFSLIHYNSKDAISSLLLIRTEGFDPVYKNAISLTIDIFEEGNHSIHLQKEFLQCINMCTFHFDRFISQKKVFLINSSTKVFILYIEEIIFFSFCKRIFWCMKIRVPFWKIYFTEESSSDQLLYYPVYKRNHILFLSAAG